MASAYLSLTLAKLMRAQQENAHPAMMDIA